MNSQNKKLIVIFAIFAISFSHFSCVENDKEKKMFPKEKNIVFTDMNVEEQLGKVVSMKSIDNYLVIAERNMETQVQLIDKKTKASYLFGQTGEGPGRFLQSVNIIPIDKENIGVFDLQKGCIFNFNIDSIVKLNLQCMPEVLIKKTSSFPMTIDRINQNTYVALCLMSGLKRFVLIDTNGEIISMEGSLPEKKDETVQDWVHAFAYWGRITTNPKESKIVICTNYAGIIQIYDCKTKEIQLVKEHNLFLADYEEKNQNFAVSPQTRWGYLALASNDKYIFALYSGKYQVENIDGDFNTSNIIHVFDWDGNPVCRLVSNKKLSTMMCVDDENLYGYDDEKADIVVANIREILSQK